jgi:hypothetical protein
MRLSRDRLVVKMKGFVATQAMFFPAIALTSQSPSTSRHSLPPSRPAMALLSNPFCTLGLAYGATDAEVQHAYTALALRAHPDKPGGSTAAFQQLLAAKELLATEALRAVALVAQPPAWVELAGLTNRPELNGQLARVLQWGFGANARWTLNLQGQATDLAIRACCCFPVAAPPPAPTGPPAGPPPAPWPPQTAPVPPFRL